MSNLCVGYYDTRAFLTLEVRILGALRWDVGATHVPEVVEVVGEEMGVDEEVRKAAVEVAGMTFGQAMFVGVRPTDMGVACVLVAVDVMGRSRQGRCCAVERCRQERFDPSCARGEMMQDFYTTCPGGDRIGPSGGLVAKLVERGFI